MLAILAAILFGVALILDIAAMTFGILPSSVFVAAGLLCLALHVAGVGDRYRFRSFRRSRI